MASGRRSLRAQSTQLRPAGGRLLAGVCVGFGLADQRLGQVRHSPVIFRAAKVATKYLIREGLFVEIRGLPNR